MTRNNRIAILNDNGAPVQPAGESSQAALDAQLWPILAGANVGTGVVTGGMVTASGGMTTTVDAAALSVLGVPSTTGPITFTHDANVSGLRRFDLLIVRAGVVTKLVGVPHGIACWPALQRDADSGELTDVALAAVLVLPDVTEINPEDITLLGVPPSGTVTRPVKAATFLPHRRRRTGTATDDEVLWSYNGATRAHLAAHLQDNCVTTSDGDIYTIYVTPTKSVIVTLTPAGEDRCAVFDLGALPGNPFETGTGWSTDPHDTMVVGISSDGYVHVSGNMHAQSLKYARCQLNTATPATKMASFEDVANWSYATNPDGHGHRYMPMVNTSFEVQTADDSSSGRNGVTYPRFVRISNGELVFTYRWGASGKGDTYLNRWNATTHAWVRIGKLIDNLTPVDGDNWNAYPQKMVPGNDNDLHVMWCDRNTGDEATNVGMFYVRFTGLGTGDTPGARDTAGTVKVLPIRHYSTSIAANQRPEVASPTAPTPSFQPPNLLNDGGLFIDHDGYPHACVSARPADDVPYQNFHLWRSATGWHQEQITDAAHGSGRNQIIGAPDGSIYIVGAGVSDGIRDGVRCWEVTPGGGRTSFLLAEFDEFGELQYDLRALLEHGLFRCFIGGGQGWYTDIGDNDLDGLPSAHFGNGVLGLTSPRTVAGVLTIDLARIADFKAGTVQLPGIRSIATAGYRDRAVTPPVAGHGAAPGDGWVNVGAGRNGAAGADDTTSKVNLSGPIIVVGREHPGRILFVRQACAIGPIATGQWAATCVIATHTGAVGSPGSAVDVAPNFRRIAPVFMEYDATNSPAPNDVMTTSWCGLLQFDETQGSLGWITAQVWPDGGTGAWVGAQMIELGELFCG
jgi:hypothetical protein